MLLDAKMLYKCANRRQWTGVPSPLPCQGELKVGAYPPTQPGHGGEGTTHSVSTRGGRRQSRGTYSSFRRSPCGKQVFRISVMLLELRSSTSKER